MSSTSEGSPWSATRRTIRRTMGRLLDTETDAVVATVVNVEGSGYRRPGARMVINSDGERQGAVTAGCLEDAVADTATKTASDGTPRLSSYDLRDGDDDVWGLGLGCNGVIDVFVEPLDASFRAPLEGIRAKRPVTVLTATASSDPSIEVGDRTVRGRESAPTGERERLPERVVTAVADELADADRGVAATVTIDTADGEVCVFANELLPIPELVLFGGQEDVNPIASLAARAGFRVRVVTARGEHADPERFPAASEVRSARPPDLADHLSAPEYSYVVLMSHNFLDDRLAFESVLQTDVPYIGLMGPRKRFQEIRESMDRTLTPRDAGRVAAPSGLDLGGDGPSAIGFSIVSEVLAVHNDRDGGRLVERDGPIHERPEIA